MQSTRDYFAGATITDGTAEEYAGEWIDLVKKYGLPRFEEALVMARRYRIEHGATIPRQFFPLPGEIEEFITTRTESPVTAVTNMDCDDCKGSGWKYADPTSKSRAVVRCHCRKLVVRQ